jgi:hypothetical protein
MKNRSSRLAPHPPRPVKQAQHRPNSSSTYLLYVHRISSVTVPNICFVVVLDSSVRPPFPLRYDRSNLSLVRTQSAGFISLLLHEPRSQKTVASSPDLATLLPRVPMPHTKARMVRLSWRRPDSEEQLRVDLFPCGGGRRSRAGRGWRTTWSAS